MKVRVKLFASYAEAAGFREREMELLRAVGHGRPKRAPEPSGPTPACPRMLAKATLA